MRKLYLLLSTFLILVLIGAGCASTSDQDQNQATTGGDQKVKVGFIGPLSGDAASYGESIKRGVQLAVKNMGQEDKVDLFFEDSKCKGKGAVNAANKLINVNNVDVIIGGVCSAGTLAAAPVAERNDVVLISAASTAKKISKAGDYIFRTIPSDQLQGKFASELMYNQGHEEIAVLYGKGSYGLGFKKVLENQFPKQGGEVLTSQGYKRGTTDVRTQLTKIKSANPDAVYIISNSPESTVAILKQAKELGIEAELFGTEGLKSEEVTKNAGRAANGLTVTAVSEGTKDFATKHKQEFDQEPGPFSAQAYDAYTAIGTAIKQGASTGQEIKNKLYSLEFEGVSGKINFDDNGDVAGNYDVYTVKEGKFTKMNSDNMKGDSMKEDSAKAGSVKVVDADPDKTITLTNNEFSKTNPKFSKGTVVKFMNEEGSHTVTLDSASINETLSEGESVTIKFGQPGTHKVYCDYHGSPGSGMHSNIRVSR